MEKDHQLTFAEQDVFSPNAITKVRHPKASSEDALLIGQPPNVLTIIEGIHSALLKFFAPNI